MKKRDLKKLITVGAVAAAAVAGTAALVMLYRKKKQDELRENFADLNAYITGGGLSALASALYLIRDCSLKPENVHVINNDSVDCGNSETGYICRRGKILETKTSPNFFDVMKNVRSLDIPDLTVIDEILNLYATSNSMRNVTLINDNNDVIDISKIRLDKVYRRSILRLLGEKKEVLVSIPLHEVFDFGFFASDFWKIVRAAYGFNERTNALEFVMALSYIDRTISGTLPAEFDRREEILEPLKEHIKNLGADVMDNAFVTDIDFASGKADAIHFTHKGVRKTVYLNEDDFCIFPTDTLADCETRGNFNESAPKCFDEPFALWQKLADKNGAFKNPSVLFSDDENKSEEFTITLSNHLLCELIDQVTCGALGKDGVIVLDNTPWKLTICAVPATHFKNQPEDVAVIWGSAARFDLDGDSCGKKMTDCSGAEILYEIVSAFNLTEAWNDIRDTVINVIPVHRMYDKAYHAPVVSKLELIPTGISNVAVSGEFAENAGSIFTEEYAASSARRAAYTLTKNTMRIKRVAKDSKLNMKRLFKRKF